MIKVRFYISAQEFSARVQDHEVPAAPRLGDWVELTGGDGTPIQFIVFRVTWTPHAVIPADVVVELTEVP